MKPPELTDEQRAAALAKAAEARRGRAELKELLKTGTITLAEVLERAEEDDIVGGIKVEALLAAMPGTGKVKAKRIMEKYEIADNRRLRGLGERQRAGLLSEFS